MSIRYEIRVNPRDAARIRRLLEPKQYAKILFDIAHKASKWGATDVRSQHWDVNATTRETLFERTTYGARTYIPGARAMAVEFGRGAGEKMPNPNVLREWASRHGLAGLEFPIARAIKAKGIHGRFFARRTRQRLRSSEIPRLLSEAIGEIKVIWSKP